MLIDTHIHLFPNRLAERAVPAMAKTAQLTPATDGTLGDTLDKLTRWGVDRAVVLHIATKPAQHHNVNQFAAQVQRENPRLLCFGSVYPGAEDAIPTLETIKELGLYGVKLHPDYQNFFVDDPAVFPLYEAASALGLPLYFHTGWDPVSPDIIHAAPRRLARVHESFPHLTIIAAHLGGVYNYDEAMEYLAGTDIWMDTAVVAEYPRSLTPDRVRRMIQKHGAHRILFASDCPWSAPPRQLELLERAGLTSGELDLITHQNAMELLRL